MVSRDVGVIALDDLLQSIQELTQKVKAENDLDLVSRSLGLDSVNSTGDTAWIIFSTIFVLLMTTPGIMLYYGGLVRLQNVLATAMQGYSIACVVTILWLCFGYSLTFSPVNGTQDIGSFVGNADRFWLWGLQVEGTHQLAPTIPEPLFCVFELSFAVITPSLICGAFADRMKFISLLTSTGLWHLIVYCPIAHSTWHPNGFLSKAGVLDFAGGNVVHVSAGFSALISALIIGKRSGFRKSNFHPHNMLVSITGACFLWCGWYGFNAGSAFASGESSSLAMLNTMIASSSASLAWMLLDFLFTGKPSVLGIMNGSLAGLVAITPAAGYVNPTGAFVIGAAGGIACSQGVKIKNYFNFDDALDAFGIHGIGGLVGGVLLGCFAKESIGGENGLFYGSPKQLGLQLYGIAITIGWSVVCTGLIMLAVDFVFGLRVSATKEVIGLDRSQHASTMYSQMTIVPKRVVIDKRVQGRSNILNFLYSGFKTSQQPSTPRDRDPAQAAWAGQTSEIQLSENSHYTDGIEDMTSSELGDVVASSGKDEETATPPSEECVETVVGLDTVEIAMNQKMSEKAVEQGHGELTLVDGRPPESAEV